MFAEYLSSSSLTLADTRNKGQCYKKYRKRTCGVVYYQLYNWKINKVWNFFTIGSGMEDAEF